MAENTEAGQSIGSPVSAFDDDGELLLYTLGGADAAFFSMSRNNGQLKTKAPLNYEARNSYSVVVTATDPSGAADSIQMTINVTDVHDPVHITGTSSARYSENGTAPIAAFTAFDEGEHTIRWSLSPNPPKDTDGRREDSGRGVRELQARLSGLDSGRREVAGRPAGALGGADGGLRWARGAR